MTRIRTNFKSAKLDTRRTLENLNRELERVAKLSASEFVQAASARVPVWSGMARGSYFELADLAGTQVIITGLRAPSLIVEGQQLGRGRLDSSGFEFESKVPHYELQEADSTAPRGSPIAPWFSLPAGVDAATRAIQNANFQFEVAFTLKTIKS